MMLPNSSSKHFCFVALALSTGVGLNQQQFLTEAAVVDFSGQQDGLPINSINSISQQTHSLAETTTVFDEDEVSAIEEDLNRHEAELKKNYLDRIAELKEQHDLFLQEEEDFESGIPLGDEPTDFDDEESDMLSDGQGIDRLLSVASAKIGTFLPLDCNAALGNDDCSTFKLSSLYPADGVLTVPCGTCYEYDLGEEAEFASGLNIEGKLLIPTNYKTTISTPFVIVQGELEAKVDHATIEPANRGVNFVLTGTNDVLFTPDQAPNAGACDQTGGVCNLGVKPFIVAGGKVDIEAFPETCSTWTTILDKADTKPVKDPTEFLPDPLPASCPTPGYNLVNYDFATGIGNWTGDKGGLLFHDPVEKSLTVTNRNFYWQGPYLDITHLAPHLCLEPEVEYDFSTKIKITKEGAETGTPITCTTSPSWENCPNVYLDIRTKEGGWLGVELARMSGDTNAQYGEYVALSGKVKLSAERLDPDNIAFYVINISRAAPGEDITIDSFKLGLPGLELYPNPDDVCGELVINGDAELDDFIPAPMTATRYWEDSIKVVKEDGNNFFRLDGRTNWDASITTPIEARCLDKGVTYLASFRLRIHSVERSAFYFELQGEGGKYERILDCPGQNLEDGWVTCSGKFIIDEDISQLTSSKLRMNFDYHQRNGAISPIIDYDDLSISYDTGVVDNLIVDTASSSCWGVGSDVHITSSITSYSSHHYVQHEYTGSITQVTVKDDGTYLTLDNAPTVPIISKAESDDFAAEVALLSRNVGIEGATGEENKGAYMQILHTPETVQTIEGVELKNMGRLGEVDRFPLQMVWNGAIPGSSLSKNSIIESNQRCLVIFGTSNVTMSGNVAYQNVGHCYQVEFQSKHNVISNNLASDVKAAHYAFDLNESDDRPAAFVNAYSPNEYVGNVAVGSARKGFWFYNNWYTRNEDGSRDSSKGNPREIPLSTFKNNIAKSSYEGFAFEHFEAAEPVTLETCKAFKNRYYGLYVYNGHHMTINNGFFSDNEISLYLRRSGDMNIANTNIHGVSPLTKELLDRPGFIRHCDGFDAPIGYRTPVSVYRPDRFGIEGAALTNVNFADFDVDNCSDGTPASIEISPYYREKGYWDFTTSLTNVGFDNDSFEACTDNGGSLKNVLFTDTEGLLDPTGLATGPSSILSNVESVAPLLDSTCSEFSDCLSYCPNSCLQTIAFQVDQFSSRDVVLSLTRSDDGSEVLIESTYAFDDDFFDDTYYDNYRRYVALVPMGSYDVRFLDGDQTVWPQFVTELWAGGPACEHLSVSNVNVIEPDVSCNELVVNGDFEDGIGMWYHRGGDVDGGIRPLPGGGIDGSNALEYVGRTSKYHGPGQRVSTACTKRNSGKFYEISYKFKITTPDTVPTCDVMAATWRNEACPSVTFRFSYYRDPNTKESLRTRYHGDKAFTVFPFTPGEFNLIHGVIPINSEFDGATEIFQYVEKVHQSYDLIIDDASITVLDTESACDVDLIRHGNFAEGNIKWWRPRGSVELEMVTTSDGYAVKASGRRYEDWGLQQYLYASCLEAHTRYAVTGRYRLENSSNEPVQCDHQVSSGLLECSSLRIDSRYPSEHLYVAETVVEAGTGEWSTMSGIYVVPEKHVNPQMLYLFSTGVDSSLSMIYDEVSITPLPSTCQSLVLNPSFEDGTSSFWSNNRREYNVINIVSPGADSSNYAVSLKHTTWWSNIRQRLDQRCLIEGNEFTITGQMKLLDDAGEGVTCDPSSRNSWDGTLCPFVRLYGTDCVGSNEGLDFYNDIPFFQWNPDDFNAFERTFSVSANLATCEGVWIELGRALSTEHTLVVDDIQISALGTESPSMVPSASPIGTQSESPSSTPSKSSYAPSVTTGISCPENIDEPSLIESEDTLIFVSEGDSLCTVTKVKYQDDGVTVQSIAPIARSYDGYPWESAAGEIATSLFRESGIVCYSNGCQMSLVPEDNAKYFLTKYERNISSRDEAARFLEQATFGITQSDIEQLLPGGTNLGSLSQWLKKQMNATESGITSHREFWRKGANPRLPGPVSMGIGDHPCDAKARWRSYTFVPNDMVSWSSTVLNINPDNGPYILSLSGQFRTVADDIFVEGRSFSSYPFNSTYDYTLCDYPRDGSDSLLRIRLEDDTCEYIQNPKVDLGTFENLASYVVDLSGANLQTIDEGRTNGEEFILVDGLDHESCTSVPPLLEREDPPVFGKLADGTWLQFDPRQDFFSNTVEDPLIDGGKGIQLQSGGESYCSNAPRSFLNEEHCTLSTSSACSANSIGKEIEITLDETTIAKLYELSGRYVYGMKGLPVTDITGASIPHPCMPKLRSRWLKKDLADCDATTLGTSTNSSLFELIQESSDPNPDIHDIFFPETGMTCDSGDTDPNIEIVVDDVCWSHVHPDYMSVHDLTYWVDVHMGGPDKITKWHDELNSSFLTFPSWHELWRWGNNYHKFPYVGRVGDHLLLRDLPNVLRTDSVIDFYSEQASVNDNGVLVCGSAGEVKNEKDDGFVFDVENGYVTERSYSKGENKNYAWIMISLMATDQLRQRVAWALAQILVVVRSAVSDERSYTEHFLQYYDIFVRNAFGNYRNILKEISYSPLMAENLSYLGSRSHAYMWEHYHVKAYADENFAREIMQLFSIGLVELNMDGTEKISDGMPILTYTNEDIMSFSRAWTGFDLQARRGNIEPRNNYIDPMQMEAAWHDKFPKVNFNQGYIGDGYPLCEDLPPKAFLKQGAKYRLLGSSVLPDLMTDPATFADYEAEGNLNTFVLDDASLLKQKLCNMEGGQCNFKNSITLDLPIACTGIECDVDTVRVVQVSDAVFYEYVQMPCVQQTFFNNGKHIMQRYRSYESMCANPVLPVASEACCTTGTLRADRNSIFDGERMIFDSVAPRCEELSQSICDYDYVNGDRHVNSGFFWTDNACDIRVKVSSNGMLTVVHEPSSHNGKILHVDEENENYFKVYWDGGEYPSAATDDCGACDLLIGGTCLCSTEVEKSRVFRGMPRSIQDLESKLFIGALNPLIYSEATYTSITDELTSITAHLKEGKYDIDTVFEYVDDKGRKKFLKNSEETVIVSSVGGTETPYSFRNTPQFMSFIPSETTKRDAQNEIDATLDTYFYHDNTAPFLASRLIQRLVTSNPTPRYVEAVASAFKAGIYSSDDGLTFGTSNYGDLSATFAAIFLDREARNPIVDKDPSNGMLREPILKVLSLMRSMEFVSQMTVTRMDDMVMDIGQMAHEFTTVFSFFLPEFKPYGRVGDATLVAPEGTLLDMPKIVGILNGLTSLVKFGLSHCGGGFGPYLQWSRCYEQTFDASQGNLNFGKAHDTVLTEMFETFEGPNLNGGFDHVWVGPDFGTKASEVVVDPDVSQNDYAVHFTSRSDWRGNIFSPVFSQENASGPYLVKYRYYSSSEHGGGCIGLTADESARRSGDWVLCDLSYGDETMLSNGEWITCQFPVPEDRETFRVVLADYQDTAGDAFFDDVQVIQGIGNATCQGVDLETVVPPGEAGNSEAVVDELATLLTAGRLDMESRRIIREAYDDAGSADEGLQTAQQLILTTSEYHSTNIVKHTQESRAEYTFPELSEKPYKATIFMMFAGGCDSYNMLAPYSCTGSKDLYQEYLQVRQQVALTKAQLLEISASGQICESFGVHSSLPAVSSLYEEGDLAFFANHGVLTQLVDKSNWNTLTASSLFAHNHQQEESKRIDPFDRQYGTGILGRITDAMAGYGHTVGSFSIDRYSVALVGIPGVTGSPMIVNRNGVADISISENIQNVIKSLHNATAADSGFFAETWSEALTDAFGTNALLGEALANAPDLDFPNTGLGRQLETVASLIATREERGVDTDTFYVEIGGWDTHSDVEARLIDRFEEVNDAIAAFTGFLKTAELWQNVTTVQLSDFARTLIPNSGDGTDHAWGGNYMMFGGAVKGGQILGDYPDDITDEGPLGLGRGRLIPTTPLDAIFHGIAEWMGVEPEDMSTVCPNCQSFPDDKLHTAAQLFD